MRCDSKVQIFVTNLNFYIYMAAVLLFNAANNYYITVVCEVKTGKLERHIFCLPGDRNLQKQPELN